MKKIKKMLALVLAMAMVVGSMSISAFAEDEPVKGSITVNSPVVSATYDVYKVFDMTTNATEDAFSYTIDATSPFYGKVVEFANTAANGMTLSRIAGSDPATYNVSVDETKFKDEKVQDFGKAMQYVLTNGAPAVVPDEEKGIVAKDAWTGTVPKAATKVADVASSSQLKFEDLALGYYLVNPTYPNESYGKVTMGSQEFTVDDLVKDATTGEVKDDPMALTSEAEDKVNTYVESQIGANINDAKFTQYLTDKGITTNKDGSPLDDAGKQEYYDELKTEMTNDAKDKILAVFANKLAGSEADINVKEEPTLVFLDSSKPDAVINEKNELDKWDVPVNPEGDVQPGTPDHGEPKGGKNIVVQESPAYYADWSEAEIGDSVHYQLRVNAMNFIRTGDTDKDIQQVKEYFLADFQSAHMHFDKDKGLKVTVWQGNDSNDSQNGMTNVTKDKDGTPVGFLDYTAKAEGAVPNTFFKNGTDNDAATGDYSKTNPIWGEGTGIMVPWVIVSKDASLKSTYPVYTTTNIPKVENGQPVYKTEDPKMEGGNKVPVKVKNEATGEWETVAHQFVSVNNKVINDDNQLLDDNGNPIQDTEPVYTYSLYSSDVTIVVDYWMILDDDAIVDEPGNKNFAQYGWSPVDNKDENNNPKEPTNPKDDDKPSQKEDVDEATVYTFALAWVKVDHQGKELAGAKFQLPFYVKKTTENGSTYVYAGDRAGDGLTNEVVTTAESAVITIKGVKQGKYSITETEAPEGYNKLTAPFEVEAKKSGNGVTTKTKTTIYLDADGNVTDTETAVTVEYETDADSFNKAGAADGEETSVPVYQFDYIENKQGTELPSTGGIGTTIFYVLGSILVICAGVVLVTRRRMSA